MHDNSIIDGEKGQHASSSPEHHGIVAADDEAGKVLNVYDGPASWSVEEERQLRRRVDWRLMPVLCLTYMLQYYDKAMLGQAAIFGLRKDLELTVGDRYSMSAAIFYLGFIAGTWPTMLLAQRFPIERVASGIVILWGVTLMLTTVTTSYRGLYAQRFFLGALESGVSPMFMMVVGSWYRKKEQAFRVGIWYSMTGYGAIVSPLINYGIGHISGAHPWKYMYYMAASLTIAWGILILFLLPPDPIRARGFNVRERYILVARLKTNNSGVRNKRFKIHQAIELLTDIKFWLVFWIALLCMVSNGALSTFLPIVIQGFGFNTLNSLLLITPSGAYAGTMMLILSYSAMRWKNIGTWLVFGAQMGTTLSSALLYGLSRHEKGGRLFAAYILPSVGAGYSVLMGMSLANTAGYTKRSLASAGLYIGYCLGNFVGPLVYLEDEEPEYGTGWIVTLVTAAIAGVLALVYRVACIWENRRRDRSGTMEAFDHAYEDPTDRENQQFRYIY